MTIIANEIRIRNSITDVTLIQVADRRITINGKIDSNQRKIFPIPHLKASIGYFGLAKPTGKEYFSSWLPNTIVHSYYINSIKDFALFLTQELNNYVPKLDLINNPSGFHLCGLAKDGIPEFYYIHNIKRRDGPYYKEFRDVYSFSEDFRTRDAIKKTNVSLTSLQNIIFWYVNGDLRNFWEFWMPATQFIDAMSLNTDFPR